MYKNMPSVLLGGFLGGSDGRTPLGQPDPETRTGRTTPKILTRKPGSDGQQPPRASPTLSETKSTCNILIYQNSLYNKWWDLKNGFVIARICCTTNNKSNKN